MEGRVLVDADSCPKRVRNWLLSQAKKNHIQLIFAANKVLSPKNGDGVQDIPNFKMIKLPVQSQAADNWILQNAAPGDLDKGIQRSPHHPGDAPLDEQASTGRRFAEVGTRLQGDIYRAVVQ